jgi:ferric-dicitrate binding protein FerR (iron transport regulator)
VDETRLLDLLDDYLEGNLEGGDSAELQSTLRASADARRVYWEYLGGHALIRELELERAGATMAAGDISGAVPKNAARRAKWAALAAAAMLLVAAGAVGSRFFPRRAGTGPKLEAGESLIELAGGTQVIQKAGARVSLRGPGDGFDEVIRLQSGEIEVRAAEAGAGRRSVRVDTPLGSVETVGTVFSVGLRTGERNGGGQMRTGRMAPLAAALMLVTVMEGKVLVRSGLGATEVQAGETAKVEKAGEEKAGQAVDGLQLNFSRRVVIRKSITFVEKDGKRVEVADPNAREYRRVELLAELKNVGRNPIAFKTFSKYVIPREGELAAPKVHAEDAEGKAVPQRERRTYGHGHARKRGEAEKPVSFSITVLKPGQSMPVQAYTHMLNFPTEGQYSLHLEWEVKADPRLAAAGLKLWSGKLSSNSVKWKYEDRAKKWRERMERQHGKKPAEKAPAEKKPAAKAPPEKKPVEREAF